MKKKPEQKLEIVIEPPADFSDKARELWRAVVPARVRSPGGRALLELALRALDRAAMASAQVAEEGMLSITATTGAKHLHPLLKVERENRQLFARVMKDLGLDWHQPTDGAVL